MLHSGLNPFLLAAKCDEIEQIKCFIKDDPAVVLTSIDDNKHNALHLSAHFGSSKVSEFLIEAYGFEMFDTRNAHSLNPFLLAVKYCKVDQIMCFINLDSSMLTSVDTNKNNALHLSTQFRSLQVSELLIEEHGFDIFNTRNIDGLNPFLLAAKFGKVDQVTYFVNKYPGVSTSLDLDDNNALHLSVQFGSAKA